jgi:hypothetical protein
MAYIKDIKKGKMCGLARGWILLAGSNQTSLFKAVPFRCGYYF